MHHHLLLASGHLLEPLLPAVCHLLLLRGGYFSRWLLVSNYLISLSFESLRSLSLLDVLLKLFVFLSAHLVNLLLWESGKIL